eukprot:6002889-Prymnesium_polylepis.1
MLREAARNLCGAIKGIKQAESEEEVPSTMDVLLPLSEFVLLQHVEIIKLQKFQQKTAEQNAAASARRGSGAEVATNSNGLKQYHQRSMSALDRDWNGGAAALPAQAQKDNSRRSSSFYFTPEAKSKIMGEHRTVRDK